MHLYIISGGITSFSKSDLTSSSSKYELGLAKALSKYCRVTILSASLPRGVFSCCENLILKGIKAREKGIMGYRRLNNLISSIFEDGTKEQRFVIFWGYNPFDLAVFLKAERILKLKCIPFIYDHHGEAIKNLSFVKKTIVDHFYRTGLRLVRRFKAFILFQESAATEMKLSAPFLVSKPGVDSCDERLPLKTDSPSFNLVFAGTLSHLNGIDVLLEGFVLANIPNAYLHIYGSGPLGGLVSQYCTKYDHILFHGRVSDQALQVAYANADLLVSLRIPDDYAMKFSFPSKLFEYMATGRPVLTTRIISDFSLDEYVYVVDDMSTNTISSCLKSIYADSNHASTKAENARAYVCKHYNYDTLSQDIIQFLKQLNGQTSNET